MDEEVKQLCDELCTNWVKNNPNTSIRMYENALSGRAETKLASLGNEVDRLQRELDVCKTQADVWKQSYLEQIKENVIMQARMLANEQA
jgi:hypothetical protein